MTASSLLEKPWYGSFAFPSGAQGLLGNWYMVMEPFSKHMLYFLRESYVTGLCRRESVSNISLADFARSFLKTVDIDRALKVNHARHFSNSTISKAEVLEEELLRCSAIEQQSLTN